MSFAEHMGEAREKQTDAWHRELNDGRIEIMCKGASVRIRIAAPEELTWRFVDLFEELTGLTVQSDRRPRRAPSVPAGQLTMIELESDGNSGGAHGTV